MGENQAESPQTFLSPHTQKLKFYHCTQLCGIRIENLVRLREDVKMFSRSAAFAINTKTMRYI